MKEQRELTELEGKVPTENDDDTMALRRDENGNWFDAIAAARHPEFD